MASYNLIELEVRRMSVNWEKLLEASMRGKKQAGQKLRRLLYELDYTPQFTENEWLAFYRGMRVGDYTRRINGIKSDYNLEYLTHLVNDGFSIGLVRKKARDEMHKRNAMLKQSMENLAAAAHSAGEKMKAAFTPLMETVR